ncbi:hypothetical protein GCM10009664_22740 [Kitasatospora gansuensis]
MGRSVAQTLPSEGDWSRTCPHQSSGGMVSAAPLHGHHHDAQPIPRTQDGVAVALPPAQRMEFYREMGEATDEEIGGVLRRWWLRAELYRDPEGDRIHAALQAGTAPGTPASEVLRRRGDR